jgi:sugar lactone lactonase YvrE
MNRGFTLIQISILLIAASLVLVAILPSTRTTLNANNATTAKLNGILTAMRGYEAKNAALPCPADASQPIGSTSYGVAAANSGTGSPGNCTGGTPAANYVDTTNNVAVGMVPVRALGLSNDYALDAYGRDITYAVDTNATVCFSGTLPGKITVTDNGTANTTIAALVSHGADGHGAWIPLTGSSGSAVRLNSGSTDTNTLLNAHVNGSFTPYTPLTNFVRSPPSATFDDLLVYKSNLWRLNAAPGASASLLPSVVGPSSGSYYTGQTLSFTVTYGSAVTVTGTPELTLSVPQSSGSNAVRYATYMSSSGNTATFTYTVQSTDYVPSTSTSATVSSPIVLNSGSITVGGGAACLTFTPPSLTGVLLNPVIIYVTDSNNNRVQEFSGTGTWQGSIGGTSSACSSCLCTNSSCPVNSGTGNGQFNYPWGIAVDSSGNVWVGDNGNHRIEEFSSSGTYLKQLSIGYSDFWMGFDKYGNMWSNNGGEYTDKWSTTGTSLLSLSLGYYPGGIALDTSGNVWVANGNGNTISEYTNTGTSVSSFTTSGLSALNQPAGMAFDGGGNLWVASSWVNGSSGSDAVFKYNTSGTYLAEAGCGGVEGSCNTSSAAGFFAGPQDVAVDPSGNIWVTDGGNNRIEEFNNCGTYLSQFGSAGTGNGQFNGPLGIAIYPNTPGGGGACVATLTPPANGAYSTGQALTFTVTYNNAVTVTGSPELTLTIGSNTRYANYVSGSGGTTLTFTYTIQSSDTATGIAVGTSISLNGGTITTTGNGVAANLAYTAPSMGGIVINSTAFLLVADYQNNNVQKLDLEGDYIFQIGACSSGACSALQGNGQLYNPYGVAVDGSGNIWVADSSNSRVQEFSSTGTWLASLGGTGSACTACLCTGPSTCPTSPGSGNGQMWGPFAVAIDGSGNIWVVDSSNKRVNEYSSSGTYLGEIGTTVTPGCGPSQFTLGEDIHLDSAGNVYVADNSCGQIEEFTSSRSYVKTFGPTIPGYGTISSDLDDFAFDSCGNIWWQDEGNDYFLETDYAGNFIQKVYGFGNGGMQSLGIDSTGKIYSLEENGDDFIDKFNSSGAYLGHIGAGSGSGPGQFNEALGMTIVGSAVTRLPISSCPAVILSAAGPTNGTYTTGGTLGFAVTYDQAVTVTGTPQISVNIGGARTANYVSGSGTTTLTFQYTVTASDNANAGTGITMNVPISLNGGTISSNSISSDLYFQPPTLTQVLVNPVSYSNFYIADSANHRVRKVTSSTGYISTVAGTGTSGAFTAGTATSSKLNTPSGVALDGSGNLYIADSGDHAVAKVNTSGTLSYFAGTGTSGTITAGAATSSKLNSPTGVAFDGSGNAYIADGGNSEVLKVNTSGTLSVFAGTGTSGTITAGAATSSKLNSPTGVAVDSSGNVYIADGGNHEVLKVNTSGTLSVFAGTGASGSTNDNNGSAATSAKLKTPYRVAVDSSGNVYIADSGNDVILEVAASSGKIAIVTGTVGTASYTGDGGAATSATESGAKGVAVDSSGNVYIADTGNNLIRWIITSFGDINPIAGNGTGGYSGDGAAATSGEIKTPTGVAVSR